MLENMSRGEKIFDACLLIGLIIGGVLMATEWNKSESIPGPIGAAIIVAMLLASGLHCLIRRISG